VGFRSRSALGHAFEVLIYFERESLKEVKIGIRFTILTAPFLFPEATNETLMLSILGGGTVLAVSTAIFSVSGVYVPLRMFSRD
jgi:hypothetical protein